LLRTGSFFIPSINAAPKLYALYPELKTKNPVYPVNSVEKRRVRIFYTHLAVSDIMLGFMKVNDEITDNRSL